MRRGAQGGKEYKESTLALRFFSRRKERRGGENARGGAGAKGRFFARKGEGMRAWARRALRQVGKVGKEVQWGDLRCSAG